jgi:DNA-directed RNA polymerase specialized sigma24 family protein
MHLADQIDAGGYNPAPTYGGLAVWNLLGQIPAEQAEALVRRVVRGYSLLEVARARDADQYRAQPRPHGARSDAAAPFRPPALAEALGVDA